MQFATPIQTAVTQSTQAQNLNPSHTFVQSSTQSPRCTVKTPLQPTQKDKLGLVYTGQAIARYQVTSELQCADHCLRVSGCGAFNYQTGPVSMKLCEIVLGVQTTAYMSGYIGYKFDSEKERKVKGKSLWPSLISSTNLEARNILRLPYSLSGVFSYQPLTLLIRVGYPQTYIPMESL